MYLTHPFYINCETPTGAYSHSTNIQSFIPQSRQNGILSKVDIRNFSNIIQSIPISEIVGLELQTEEITAFLAYYRYVFIIIGDLLIKMDTHPEMETYRVVRGFTGTKLIAGASIEGPHIYTITGGKLLKMRMDTLEIVGSDSNSDWENASLMAGSGDNLYIIKGDDLINVDGKNLNIKTKIPGWTNTNLLTAPGDSYLYIFKNGELIRMNQYNFQFDKSTRNWEGTTLMTGTGRAIFIVRNGELIELVGKTLERNTNVPTGSGWEKATYISVSGSIYLITEEPNSFMSSRLMFSNYTSYNQHDVEFATPLLPYYCPLSYCPYYLYPPYYFQLQFFNPF